MQQEQEPNGSERLPAASDVELKWFTDLSEVYWVPSTSFEEEQNTLFKDIRRVLPDSTPVRFLDDLTRAQTNIKSVQDFLQIPYDAVTGAMALANVTDDGVHADKTPLQRGRFVAHVLQHEHIKSKLDSMMRQSVVLLWGAYETFSRDLFVSVLNEKPALLSKLVATKSFKDRFPLNSIFTPDSLEAAGYDLNGKLGRLLAEGKDFSAPWMLRNLFPALFKGGSLEHIFGLAFERPELWTLGHRRHIVAHRCGIVDEAYMRETGDKSQTTGELLKVTRKDLRVAFGIVHVAIAVAVASAAELYGTLKEIPDAA